MDFATIKGFRDILPEEVGTWQRLGSEARRIFRSFGFREIKPPLLEKTELFTRSIGEETDIVSKEMYSFTDSKGRGLTLRPEATASVVRAYIQHRLYQKNPVQKLFTIGPMFRHERPQKGRFRQFHQIDAEIIGDSGPLSDAEIIVLAMSLVEAFGLSGLSLQINSLGCPKCRPGFKEKLKSYLSQKAIFLCGDCQRRALTNPLRVFDCKVEGCKQVVAEAPSILDFICSDCEKHFKALQKHLDSSEVSFALNHMLVRGLDYYTRTTFEIQTEELGSQNAVVGGGRYDGLCKQLGGPDHPAIGFALGMERLVALMGKDGTSESSGPDLFLAALGEKAQERVFQWANDLRKAGFCVEIEYDPSKSLKAQMKRADRLGARLVLMVGENELSSGKGILRDMVAKTQKEVGLENLTANIKELMG
ncbi:MAG: histidine--tRNA ligase [Deltaproteobacteria bacterium]|nr:histidine--tRNA ligase [Deltaproteobacteria bacterium]